MMTAFPRATAGLRHRLRHYLSWLLLAIPSSVQAQVAGSLDSTFSQTNGPDNGVASIVIQPDNRILLSGFFDAIGGSVRHRLARLQSNGVVEPLSTFSSYDSHPFEDKGSIALLPDGRMIVGGSAMVTRLLPNGSRDPSFNPDVTVAAPASQQSVSCVRVQPDGKILVGGLFAGIGGVPRSNLARLLPDGTVESLANFGGFTNGRVRCIALQPDGKILLGGEFNIVNGTPRSCIARLNPDGTLESTATFDPGSGITRQSQNFLAVHTLVVQPDGKILAGGSFSQVNGQSRQNFARLLPNGSLESDASFAPLLTGSGNVYSIALQVDGKILIAGPLYTINGQTRNHIARLNPDGTLESTLTFDTGTGGNAFVEAVALQADGKILAGGIFTTFNGQSRRGLVRLNNDAAAQSLQIEPSRTRVGWLRSGAVPEVTHVSFESSVNNGTTWTPLGAGTRIAGGWEWTGPLLPPLVTVRALGRTSGGNENKGSGLVSSSVFQDTGTGVAGIDVESPQGTPVADGGSASFGTHLPGANLTRAFTVRNTGSGVLFGADITINGPDAGQFSVVQNPGGAVFPTDTTPFSIRFSPQGAAGPRTATLHLTSNAPAENPYDITLTGTAAAQPADIVVEMPAGTDRTDGGSAAFPTTATGGSSERTFVIKNTGEAQLNGFAITIDGANAGLFTVTPPVVTSLPFGESTVFSVRFTPATTGDKTAVLHIESNDPDESPFDLTLTGRVVPATAPTGIPDVTFGGTGSVILPVGTGTSGAHSMAMQSDGKILLAGRTGTGANDDFVLVRCLPGGSLDPSFNGSGMVTTDFGGADRAFAVAVQSDGKILLAGETSTDGHAFAMARYLPNGSLDTAFNGTGKVITNFRNLADIAYGIALQSDGKVLLAGESTGAAGTSNFIAVARYLSDGSLDASFGTAGKVLAATGFTTGGRGIAVQGDGKILVAGSAEAEAGHPVFALLRFTAGGQPDTGFAGGTGAALTDFGPSASANAVVLQPDGKILLAGTARTDPDTPVSVALARYTADGSADGTFNSVGRVTTSPAFHEGTAMGIALQSDGKILAAGDFASGAGRDILLLRYLPNGSLDTTFTSQGFLTASPGGEDHGMAVAVQGDGKILVAGDASGASIAMLRFRGNSVPAPELVVEQPAGVWFPPNGTADFGLVLNGGSRSLSFTLRNAGYLDLAVPTISIDGADAGLFDVTTAPPAELNFGAPPAPLTVKFTPSGTGVKTAVLHVASNDSDLNPYDIVLRGTAGDAATPAAFAVEQPAGLALPDGGVRNFGQVNFGGVAALTFALRNTGGSDLTGLTASFTGPDAGLFGVTGFPAAPLHSGDAAVFTVQFTALSAGQKSTTLRITGSGAGEDPYQITLTAGAPPWTGRHRLSDPTLGGTGIAYAVTDSSFTARSGLVQPDGKIIIAGDAPGPDFLALRFRQDGVLDPNFSGDGMDTVDFGFQDQAYGVALQADGGIVLCGSTKTDTDMAVARLNSGGGLDTSFGNAGKLIIDMNNFRPNGGRTVAVGGNGSIYCAGFSHTIFSIGDIYNIAYVQLSPTGAVQGSGDIFSASGNGMFTAVYASALSSAVVSNKLFVGGFAQRNTTGPPNTTHPVFISVGTGGGSHRDDAPGTFVDLTAQPDGKLVTAVTGSGSPAGTVRLIRYTGTGTDTDTGFGNNGTVYVPFSGNPKVLAAQSDNKILLAGTNSGGDVTIMRFRSDGTLDNSFNGSGVLSFAAGDSGTGASVTDISTMADGRIVVSGMTTAGGVQQFFAARFLGDVPTPGIVVEQPAGTVLAHAGAVDFSSVALGNSATLSFTIRNQGVADLGGLSITSGPGGNSGDFVLVSPPAVSSLPPGQSTTFSVSFAPSAAGSRNATLRIASNDPQNNPFVLNLSGTGTGSLPPLAAWRLANFGTTANIGPAADLSDPDNDGLVNLIEFGTNNNPNTGKPDIAPPVHNGSALEWTYTRPKAALADVDYLPEFNSALSSAWSPVPPASHTIVNDDGTLQVMKVTVPLDPSGRNYVRLRVQRK